MYKRCGAVFGTELEEADGSVLADGVSASALRDHLIDPMDRLE